MGGNGAAAAAEGAAQLARDAVAGVLTLPLRGVFILLSKLGRLARRPRRETTPEDEMKQNDDRKRTNRQRGAQISRGRLRGCIIVDDVRHHHPSGRAFPSDIPRWIHVSRAGPRWVILASPSPPDALPSPFVRMT